ncbi:MAG: VWA domain-containing protein [Firmicutes bacterium]|nr:VWA domain-containing protein [Bacillota bacterium]
MKNYLEINIVRFIQLLRHAGLRIGSGEVMDALRALTFIDLRKRDDVRIALQATLVKHPEEQQVFTKAFDIFFASPQSRQELQKQYQQKEENKKQQLEQAAKELTFQGKPLELSAREKMIYANIPEADRQRLLSYIRKTATGINVEGHFQPVLESVIRGSLAYWRRSLRNELDLTLTPPTEDEELNAFLAEIGNTDYGRTDSLLAEDMQNIPDKDLPRARVLIRKLARQMVARIARRYRQSRKQKKLDLRKSIRHNLRYGGSMFTLRYRSRRVQKPKILLLCDVSGSMARYASFVLQFIYGIHDVVADIESFVFAEGIERVTAYFQGNIDFTETMLTVMNNSQEWGRGTNLGAALQALQQDFERLLTNQTYLLVVSDTKTLHVADAVQELTQIKRVVKDIIWLNTLPASSWETTVSVESFRKIVRMYPCNTLSDLEQVMREKIIA